MAASIAVTGADGFIGSHLCGLLEHQSRQVIRIVRREGASSGNRRLVADITDVNNVARALVGSDAVVHLAARAHVMHGTDPDSAAAFRRVNIDGTKALCLAARMAGVRRIVFVSSIGVNGAKTDGEPFREEDPPKPAEPYAKSKWEAEGVLQERARDFGLEAVIVRPSLVYGAGAKGNFMRLLHLADSGVPLPLASVNNRRHIIGVENLCDLLILCAENHLAAEQTYLAAEPRVHSTPDLLHALYSALGRQSRLFPMSERLLRTVAKITGLQSRFDKLCGSLEVCSDKARSELGWTPQLSFEEGIARTVAWYLEYRLAR